MLKIIILKHIPLNKSTRAHTHTQIIFEYEITLIKNKVKDFLAFVVFL